MGNSYNTDKRGKFDKYRPKRKDKKVEYKSRNNYNYNEDEYTEWKDIVEKNDMFLLS